MLVDMAGSENIEQAGQNTLEAKMQVKIAFVISLSRNFISFPFFKSFFLERRSALIFVLLRCKNRLQKSIKEITH